MKKNVVLLLLFFVLLTAGCASTLRKVTRHPVELDIQGWVMSSEGETVYGDNEGQPPGYIIELTVTNNGQATVKFDQVHVHWDKKGKPGIFMIRGNPYEKKVWQIKPEHTLVFSGFQGDFRTYALGHDTNISCNFRISFFYEDYQVGHEYFTVLPPLNGLPQAGTIEQARRKGEQVYGQALQFQKRNKED